MSLKININDVAETAFLTLYCHAIDAQSKEPILNDRSSIDITQTLNKEFLNSEKKLHERLISENIDRNLVIHTVIRAKKYDEFVTNFIENKEKAIIVNIGCGLDNRFERIDDGKIEFYDLDLHEIIEIKKQFFKETNRYHLISNDVFDFSWIDKIPKYNVLFLAEGVFMYCKEEQVKTLLLNLHQNFRNSEIVCEVFNSIWLKGWLKKLINFKMQKELSLGKNATFHFGIRKSNEFEEWGNKIEFIDDWSYFDSNEKKLGWLRIFRSIELFRKTQWTVHYKLNRN